uniref:Uncharacterized protein n=1 Tax=Glossina austeni TaxID=7395 RepID=A0A1A9VFG9_GLOAU
MNIRKAQALLLLGPRINLKIPPLRNSTNPSCSDANYITIHAKILYFDAKANLEFILRLKRSQGGWSVYCNKILELNSRTQLNTSIKCCHHFLQVTRFPLLAFFEHFETLALFTQDDPTLERVPINHNLSEVYKLIAFKTFPASSKNSNNKEKKD